MRDHGMRQGGSMIEGSYPTAFPLKHQLKQECHA